MRPCTELAAACGSCCGVRLPRHAATLVRGARQEVVALPVAELTTCGSLGALSSDGSGGMAWESGPVVAAMRRH
jgi:hypothetical protein